MLAVLDGDAPVDAPWGREETAFMIDFIAAREGQRPKWWKTMREILAEPVLVHPAYSILATMTGFTQVQSLCRRGASLPANGL